MSNTTVQYQITEGELRIKVTGAFKYKNVFDTPELDKDVRQIIGDAACKIAQLQDGVKRTFKAE